MPLNPVFIRAPSFTPPGGNSTAYTNFAARCSSAGAPLAGSDITNYSTLLNGLTTDGLFASDGTSTLLEALYILAAPSATVALLDLTNNAHNITANGSPTFTAYQGYLGVDASTTVYLDTGYNPNGGGLFTQNSAHLTAWSNTNAASGPSGGIIIGCADATGVAIAGRILPKYNDGSAYADLNCAANSMSVANSNSTGLYTLNRSASNAEQLYLNGNTTPIVSNSTASSGVPDAKVTILAGIAGTSPSFGGAYQISTASIGASLSSANMVLLFNRLATYRTAVGL